VDKEKLAAATACVDKVIKQGPSYHSNMLVGMREALDVLRESENEQELEGALKRIADLLSSRTLLDLHLGGRGTKIGVELALH
jgi:hypothetical protein